MKNFIHIVSIFFLPFSILALASCSSSCFLTTKNEPPSIDITKYKQLIIGDITDAKGSQFFEISDPIFYNISNLNKFNVYDREYLRNLLMDKIEINKNVVLDSSIISMASAQLGTLIYSEGKIIKNVFREEYKPPTEERFQSVSILTRKGLYEIVIHFKFYEPQKFNLIFDKILSSSSFDEKTAVGHEPDLIDEEQLYQSCIKDITGQFINLFLPKQREIEICFEEDAQLPELSRTREKLAKGNWDECLNILKNLIIKYDLSLEARAKAYYNLALLQYHSGVLDEAVENFRVAALLFPQSTKYNNAFDNALKAREKILTEQNYSRSN